MHIKCSGDNMKYKSLEKLGLDGVKPKKKGKILKFVNKTLTAVFLGLVFLIVMEYSPKFKDFMHNRVLDKNISFGFFNRLYNKYFGEVIPSNNDSVVKVFNEKLNYKNKEKYLDGYKLVVDNNYLVPALESGIVVFIGNKENYGSVIVIEAESGMTITYGNIKNTDIKLYEYVNKGKYLGEAIGDYIYLNMIKDGENVDIEKYLS